MTALLLVLCSVAIVGVGLNSAEWRWSDPGVQALLMIGVSLIVRPLVLVFGFDTPFPDEIFSSAGRWTLLKRTQILVIVWLVVFVGTWRIFRSPVTDGNKSRRRVVRSLDDGLTAKVAVILGCAGLLLTVPLWARYGGPFGLAKAAKSRNIDSYRIRGLSVVAAFLGVAVFVRARQLSLRRRQVAGVVAYLLGAGVSFTWGARDAAIFPLVLLLLAAREVPRRLTFATLAHALRRSPRIVVALVLIVAVGFGLRAQRDIAIGGRAAATLTGRSVVRQASVALDNTQYDALMLVVRDQHLGIGRPGMPYVVKALAAGLPSPVRGGGSTFVSPGVTVAQRYISTRKNGWPLTPLGDWYFALGARGVVIGAVLSGLLVRYLDRWARDQADNTQACCYALLWLWGSSVAPGGILLTTPGRTLVIIVPVVLTLVAVGLLRRNAVAPAVIWRPMVPVGAPPRHSLTTSVVDRRRVATSRSYGVAYSGLVRSAGGRRRLDADMNWATTLLSGMDNSLLAPASAVDASGWVRMRRDTRLTLMTNLFGLVVGLGVSVLAARLLNQADFGRFSWFLTTSYIVSAVGAFGTTMSVVALAGREATEQARNATIAACVRLSSITGGLACVAMSLVAWAKPGLLGRDVLSVAPFVGVLGGVSAVLATVSAAFRSTGRFGWSILTSEQVTRSASLIALLLAVVIAGRNLAAVAGITVAITGLVAVASGVQMGRSRSSNTVVTVRSVAHRSIPFFVGALGSTVIPQAGVWTLGLRVGAEDVGMFAAALRIMMVCSVVSLSVNRTLGPRVAANRTNAKALTELLRDASTTTTWMTALLSLPFVVGGPGLVSMIFGPKFRGAWAPAVVLLIGLLVNAATGSSGLLLFNTGYERRQGGRLLLGGFVYVVASALVAGRFGAMGVAVTATGVISTLNLWQAREARRLTTVKTHLYLDWARTKTAVMPTLNRRFREGDAA